MYVYLRGGSSGGTESTVEDQSEQAVLKRPICLLATNTVFKQQTLRS